MLLCRSIHLIVFVLFVIVYAKVLFLYYSMKMLKSDLHLFTYPSKAQMTTDTWNFLETYPVQKLLEHGFKNS